MISRTNFSANSILTSSDLNSQFNTVYSRVNELPGDCITDDTIGTAKIQDNAITLDKLAAAISEKFIPAGTILPYGAATAPDGYFVCDGSAVSRTTYSDLFAVIGTSFGAGDGSTTFNLPNFEGRFLRGWSNGSGLDPDRASRGAMASGGNTGDNIGSVQSDQFKSHTHNISLGSGSVVASNYVAPIANPGPLGTATSAASGGNETRPENAYVNFIIKY